MCQYVCVFTLSEKIGIVANSLACEMWIVNDITDCKTCFMFQVFLFYSVSA